MSGSDWVVAWLAAYVGLVLAIGLWASRRVKRSPEDFFLAGRSLGTFLLFMALFGTNCTAFVLVGIPGQAYHDGVGIFSVNAPIVALGIPLTFWLIGSPARRMSARLGALTPAELYARRFGSPLVGWVFFLVFTAYTLPYMVTGVKGVAVTLEVMTDGAVPGWVGGLGVVLLTVVYTALGGMRATAWTNVAQGCVFMAVMVGSFFWMSSSLGGLREIMDRVRETDPGLLRIEHGSLFSPRAWTSWGLVISLTVIAFPHMFARLMAAKGERSLRGACRLYPLALVLLWLPAVLIGVWGAAAFPGLEGRESDQIFSRMSAAHLPAWAGPLGAVAVLASVMSTLDAQILTLSSMLVRDVLGERSLGGSEETGGTGVAARGVRAGRWFGWVIAAVVYALAQTWGSSVFDIAKIAFSGYVTLAPALFLGVVWRRFTAAGAIASIVAGNVVYVAGLQGLFPMFGFLEVFWAFLAACAAGWGVSLATPPCAREYTERAFGTA